MAGFSAIVLICLKSVTASACTEATAVEVRSVHVSNEYQCTMGWQEAIGRSARADLIGTEAYVKTLCRRVK
jgi:hypothetical protein